MNKISSDRIEGLLIGTAVGDALGLPMEGLRPAAIEKLGWSKNWRQRFFFGHGMWSDDTEHTIMLTQALLVANGDRDTFIKKFAWELRFWLLGLPSGVGMATAKSLVRLWLGISPHRSGVFSAGNGSAMRTAIIGAYFPDCRKTRKLFVEAHTRITHSDPKAVIASFAVTELATLLFTSSSTPSVEEVIALLQELDEDDEWMSTVDTMQRCWSQNAPVSALITRIGGNSKRGISGYAYQTVPAVIYLGVENEWHFEKTICAVISAGGDTDTAAAIAGALCGAFGGKNSIPSDWVTQIKEFPTHISDLKRLAEAIPIRSSIRIRPYWSPLLFVRNLFFFVVVLTHGFMRLLPTVIRKRLIS